jgi:hypothetical protein
MLKPEHRYELFGEIASRIHPTLTVDVEPDHTTTLKQNAVATFMKNFLPNPFGTHCDRCGPYHHHLLQNNLVMGKRFETRSDEMWSP